MTDPTRPVLPGRVRGRAPVRAAASGARGTTYGARGDVYGSRGDAGGAATPRSPIGPGPDREMRPRDRRDPPARRQMPLWQELPLLLVVAFCLAVLVRTFLLQAFFIPSSSMEDTLLRGDRVLVNKVVYDLRDPQRGEIVVFHGTDAWAPQVTDEPAPGFLGRVGRTVGDLVGVSRPGEKDFIKRVIGVPGDRVRCCDGKGRVVVNGVPLTEPYVIRDGPLDVPPSPRECRSRRFDEVVVPPGQLFVMGDHRVVSQDARCQGPVPIDNVIGRAFVVVWPFSRWASLSAPDTFDTFAEPAAQPIGVSDPAGTPTVLPVIGAALVGGRSRRSRWIAPRRLQP